MNAAENEKLFWDNIKVPCNEYQTFWKCFFEDHGFTVKNPTCRIYRFEFVIEFNGIEYRVALCPYYYKGVKIFNKHCGQVAKFWSESGGRKFMKRFNIGKL